MHHYELVPVQACFQEIDEILKKEHWPEVGHFKDQPIDMEWNTYVKLQAMGQLRCFTARTQLNEELKESVLIGYAFYLVREHLHYRTVKVANQDILYIRKPYRGFGREFILWCDTQLQNEGVQTVTQHVKPYFNWSHILEEMGYEQAELIFTKRLG